MNREELECAVAAGVLHDPKWIASFKGRFKAALFTDPFLLAVANAAAMDFKGKLPLDHGLAAVAGKFPDAADRFDHLRTLYLPPEDFAWARDSLLALLDAPRQSDAARDSGQDAPGSTQGGREPSPDQEPPEGHPAAEKSGATNPGRDGSVPQRQGTTEIEALLTNYDAEQALLGAMLVSEAVYTKVCGIVTAEDFADPLHGRIFNAVGTLIAKGVAPSPITLKNAFAQDPALQHAGGAGYLIDLAQSVVSIRDADDYAEVVSDLATRRHALTVLEAGRASLVDFKRDANQLVAEMMHRLPQGMGGGDADMQTKRQVREELARYVDRPGVYFKTGMGGLDALLGGGLFASKLYCLAARFKAGKSALSGSISHSLNDLNTMHGVAALEMSARELEMRDLARDLQVNSLRLMMGTEARDPIGGGRVIETMGNMNDATIYFSRPGATLADIRGFIMRAISRHKITGVIIDYHQLITQVDDMTEERHLRESAQALAKLCRQFNIWCLLVLQLNQEGNSRGGEGVKLACDAYMTLHREKGEDGAYVELELCRYKASGSMGTATLPGLMMDPHGPHFRDNTAPADDLDQDQASFVV